MAGSVAVTDPHHLLPAPRVIHTSGAEPVTLGHQSTLHHDPELAVAGRLLARRLGAAAGWRLPPAPADRADIVLRHRPGITDGPATVQRHEGYRLDTSTGRVIIEAAGEPGAHYGVQTLLQLLGEPAFRRAPTSAGPWSVPGVVIEDAPRLGYRGVLLDVARHFLPTNDLLLFIDALAAHKFNVLHLHLTDDQGWRIAIDRYPLLTERGAWRPRSALGDSGLGRYDDTPHGGYYTKADLREIVAFAAERQLTIIPEIDVPGHSRAAIAAYPWLAGSAGDAGPGVWDRWGGSELVLDPSDATLDLPERARRGAGAVPVTLDRARRR